MLSNLLSQQVEQYIIKSKIVKKNIGYSDFDGKQISETMVFLIPEPSTQLTIFFDNYLPVVDTEKYPKEKFECIAIVKTAIPYCIRLHLIRKNGKIDQHHFMVASKFAEDKLLMDKELELELIVFPNLADDIEHELGV